MWLIAIELWISTEEKLQFKTEAEYKHELEMEFEIYDKFKALFMKKINSINNNFDKKGSVLEIEDDFNKLAEKPELLSKVKSKLLGDIKLMEEVYDVKIGRAHV